MIRTIQWIINSLFILAESFSNRIWGKRQSKSTPLMEKLLEVVPPGSLILDPFAGSGTTLVAAKNTGRDCIRIEEEKGYWSIAVDRLPA